MTRSGPRDDAGPAGAGRGSGSGMEASARSDPATAPGTTPPTEVVPGTRATAGSGAAPPAATAADDSARLPEPIIEAAIAWAVRLGFGGHQADQQREFALWLHADARHGIAWQRVCALTQPFTVVPGPVVQATRSTALAQREARRRSRLKLLSLIPLGAAAAWLTGEIAPWQRLLADASTTIGERRTLRFADGTTVMLNTDTAISLRLTEDARVLVLRRGEVLVTTGTDPGRNPRRPFWVDSPAGRLHALGTRFVARLAPPGTRVSVQEGAVELLPADGGPTYVVQAGTSGWLSPASAAAAAPDDFEADGWADGVIAAHDLRLDRLLAELGRYRDGRITCAAQVAGLRVSGLFQTGDTDRTLAFLAQTLPIEVTYHTRFWISVGPRAQGLSAHDEALRG